MKKNYFSDYKNNCFFEKILKMQIKIIFFFILIIFFISCRSTRHLEKDEYLLNSVEIIIENKNISVSELSTYIKQNENTGILRTNLWIYNTFKNKKWKWTNWISNTVGEAPVIYDENLTKKTCKQLKLYLKNKGYYYAEVKDSIFFNKKKANLFFLIKTKKAYFIKNIKYEFAKGNKIFSQIVLSDTINSLIKKNQILDLDILQEERNRLENVLKDSSYFRFSQEFINYEIDSNFNKNYVDLKINFLNIEKNQKHKKFKFKNIYVFTNYNSIKANEKKQEYFSNLDTFFYKNYIFLYEKNLEIKPSILIKSIFLKKNDFYSLKKENDTKFFLRNLKIFKLINISYKEIKTDENEENKILNCYIYLKPFELQSYSFELEGTNNSGNFGTAGNLVYQHKNTFNHVEFLDFRIKGALELQDNLLQKTVNEEKKYKTLEYGWETNFKTPQFWFPYHKKVFIDKYMPKSNISFLYNYQKRPDYTRKILNISYGYIWKSSQTKTHFFNIVEINSVKLLEATQKFKDYIDKLFISDSYEDHLISVSNYRFIYNNKIKNKNKYFHIITNFESAGNLISFFDLLSKKEDRNYLVFGQKYPQYIKSDIDLRFYLKIDKHKDLVFRNFIGVGLPYGNMNVLPFEKKYFSGGANGIRAWAVRSLGPGSYKDTLNKIINQSADIKIETNLEYRFDIFEILEGAIFIDAGNIWAINAKDNREGSYFNESFLKDFAIGTGFGMRFDFSFFIFRIDAALKIRDPSLKNNSKLVFKNDNIYKDLNNNLNFNFGIGYPF